MRPVLAYKSYRLENVYQQITPEIAEDIQQLWIDTNTLTPVEASRRVKEVVYTVRSEDNKLVGVNTVYRQDFLKKGDAYYFYRVFLHPRNRGVFGLRSLLTQQTREFLKQYDDPQGHAKGVVIVAENKKFSRKGAIRMLKNNGWSYLGKGPRGFDVWYVNFDGSLINN